MPAKATTILSMLERELQQKLADLPLELLSVPELFDESGTFSGADTFFNQDQPDVPSFRETLAGTESLSDTVSAVLHQKSSHRELVEQISREEALEVKDKLVTLLSLPAGQLDSESELYLEQQLSDLLGFEVTSRLESHSLLYNTGKVQAFPHLRLHPTDTLEKHTYTHALLDSKRSSYGWFLEQGAVTEQSELLEKYFVALPLYFFPDWQQDHKQTKQWYKHRKLVLINPIENMLVVVAVGAIGPTIPSRYQCGASPEVIIEGKFWTAAASGKSLLLFVDDPNNTVPLGPQQLIKNL